MRILHVMKIFPNPPLDGFRCDIWDRIRSMRNLGYSVHVLITIREGEGHQNDSGLRELRSMVDRVDLVERAPRFRSLLGLRPSLVARNDTLAAFQLNGEYDMTIAESEHVIPIFDNPLLRSQ